MAFGKQTPVCEECGSDDVCVDAWAVWDESAQSWDISSTFEQNAICNGEACDGGECSIKWKEWELEPVGEEVKR